MSGGKRKWSTKEEEEEEKRAGVFPSKVSYRPKNSRIVFIPPVSRQIWKFHTRENFIYFAFK